LAQVDAFGGGFRWAAIVGVFSACAFFVRIDEVSTLIRACRLFFQVVRPRRRTSVAFCVRVFFSGVFCSKPWRGAFDLRLCGDLYSSPFQGLAGLSEPVFKDVRGRWANHY